MREVEANGTRLSVLDRGHGTPIVFVHGAVADYRVWETQVKSLAASHRAVAYSLRHHFPNSHRGEIHDYTTLTHAEDLAALLRTLGEPRVHLVGHSFGGRVAALAAMRHPKLIRSLVLAEPSIFTFLPAQPAAANAMATHRELADNLLAKVLNQGGPEAAAAFIDAMAAPRVFSEFPARLREIVLANAHTLRPLLLSRLAEPAGLFRDLPELKLPVLLVEGELSPQLFKLAVVGLRTALPHADHATMRGVAHGLHVEAPRFFNDLLRRFLARH
jgi:non-heme chloroperoxidase